MLSLSLCCQGRELQVQILVLLEEMSIFVVKLFLIFKKYTEKLYICRSVKDYRNIFVPIIPYRDTFIPSNVI